MTPISFRESQIIVYDRASALRSNRENIQTREAIHRVLAQPVYALRSNPSCELAAMDGIAINTSNISSFPTRLTEWKRINTGELIDPQWNAVVKIEDVKFEGDVAIVDGPIAPMQNIRMKGEDFIKDSLLFAAGHLLSAPDLSLLLAAGHESIEVLKKPVITFLPTGSELITDNQIFRAESIIESNSAMVRALVESWGGVLKIADPIADDASALRQAIREAVANSDIVIVSAGTSMGTRDLTASTIQELGTLWFHGVQLQPAKPVLMGQIGDVPIVGMPGYPVAAYVTSLYFLQPLVKALSGLTSQPHREVHISAEDLPPRNLDQIYRVNLFEVDGRTYVRKSSRGASSVLSLARMDGLMHVPAGTEIHKRDGVRIDIIHDRSANTLAIRGAWDPAFNHLFDQFKNAMATHRILFWEADANDALQSIIEKNCHLAFINTFTEHDLFPEFARQLQENMLRYRILSRTVGLLISGLSTLNSLHDLPNDFQVAVPQKNLHLWNSATKLNAINHVPMNLSDEGVLRWTESLANTGAFVDIRFLKTNEKVFLETQEHFDLIVSESYSELPPIKKLIELLISPQFNDWISSFRGCEPGSRGLLHETYDVL
jgi:putative molybdopterin biosynthesis protein